MEPVSETPTTPADYAALSAVYGTLLAASAYAGRHQDGLPARELVPLSAATFALSKLIAKEKVETWIREPFVEETAHGRQPKGERVRYAIGELLTCTRCVGAWCALGLVGLRLAAPGPARTVTSVLAASAGNDFLHTGFTWLCARSNQQQCSAEVASRQVERLAASPEPDPQPHRAERFVSELVPGPNGR